MHGHLWQNTLGKFYVSSANNRPIISTGYNGITGFYWLELDKLPFFFYFYFLFAILFNFHNFSKPLPCVTATRFFNNIP